MKNHLKKAILLGVCIFSLAFASHAIPWDETPIEQSFLALPLGIGFLFQRPFFWLIRLWIESGASHINYELIWAVIPLMAGIFYASMYYFIASFFIKKPARA